MIDYASIRTDVVSGLNEFMNIPVVMLEQSHPKPPYPFLGYKSTTFTPESGREIETMQNVPSADPDFEHDVEITQHTQPTITMSITAYSRNSDESYELALKAYSWFSFHGYEQLKDSGIIVAQLMNVQNRDTLVVGDYERREGFDTILRVTSAQKRTVASIEDIQTNETINK